MRKLVAAVLIVTVVAGGLSNVAYAHHKEDHSDSAAVGSKPGRSNPDENGNGPERDGGAADPAGENAPHPNNGCGNDLDRIDDNEGWCGRKPSVTPTPGDTPEPTSTPEPPVPTSTPEPPTPSDPPEMLPPVKTPEPPISQDPIDEPENTPLDRENWKDVRTCLPTSPQPEVITVYVYVPMRAEVTNSGNYDLVAMLGGLVVVGYVAKRRTS